MTGDRTRRHLVTTTAVAALLMGAAAPAIADPSEALALSQTDPRHLDWSDANADDATAPVEPQPGPVSGDAVIAPAEASASDRLASEPGARDAARELGALLEAAAQKRLGRKASVEFKPEFTIRAPSRRPRYDRTPAPATASSEGRNGMANAPDDDTTEQPTAAAAKSDRSSAPSVVPDSPVVDRTADASATHEAPLTNGIPVPARSPRRTVVRVDAVVDHRGGPARPAEREVGSAPLRRDVPRRHPGRSPTRGAGMIDPSADTPAANDPPAPDDGDPSAGKAGVGDDRGTHPPKEPAPTIEITNYSGATPKDSARGRSADEDTLEADGIEPAGGASTADPSGAEHERDNTASEPSGKAGHAVADDPAQPSSKVDTTPIPPGPAPQHLVRMLSALQDDIARGSSSALSAQSVLLRRIADRFRNAAPREWEETPTPARSLPTRCRGAILRSCARSWRPRCSCRPTTH